jgi:methylphosphonate synthase
MTDGGVSMDVEGFDRRAGALLRAAANDLKRDDENAERELGLEPGTFREYADGRRPLDWALIRRAAEVWPLNERDLLPVHDDCAQGVRICRAKESEASSRVLSRAGRPYYEYRDTAMSRLGSYRPEWIRMLQTVADDHPDNPDVQWNRGHLLYQFTYFVGPVNYYCEWDGVRRCIPMDTGDSVWGLPFAPHSFTSRSDTEPAYILALTYGGDLVGDAQRELSVLGAARTRELALDAFDQKTATAAALRSLLEANLLGPQELTVRTGLSADRLRALLDGAASADPAELTALASCLAVSVRDLLPPVTATDGGVAVRFGRDASSWLFPAADGPAYRVSRLAGDPLHPHTTALQIDVLAGEPTPAARMTTYQHQYVYALGGGPVTAQWESGGTTMTAVIEDGDSLYVEPRIPIGFAAAGPDRGQPPRLLLLRIGGAARTEVRSALSAMARGGIERYISEDRLWYRKEGS